MSHLSKQSLNDFKLWIGDFWSLAIACREDDTMARMPMLPVAATVDAAWLR